MGLDGGGLLRRSSSGVRSRLVVVAGTGELATGRSEGDLGPVLGGDVLVGTADAEQPAVGVEDRFGDHAHVPA
ncbi:hypothetical protein ACFYZJ_38790 [Streptomyces sp. NPDC001848]|uniref:hypothetical protein n=1 Tax=Streptomyces sp. NPDC001848 TaxID=3364618 RepID=UPI00367F6A94